MSSSNNFDFNDSENQDRPPAKKFLKYIGRAFRSEEDAPPEARQGPKQVNLSDYHLPDEYCDPAMFSYHPRENSDGDVSSQAFVGSLFHFGWRNPATLTTTPEARLSTSHCHLPDDYIDVTITYDPSDFDGDNGSSSPGDLFGSIAALFGGGDDKVEEKEAEKENNGKRFDSLQIVNLKEYDLPDEYVDAVISCDATSSQGDKEEPDYSGSQSSSLDRLNDKIRNILFNPSTTESLPCGKRSSFKKESFVQISKERHVVWENRSSVASLDSSVPRPNLSRAGSSLRKRTPQKSEIAK